LNGKKGTKNKRKDKMTVEMDRGAVKVVDKRKERISRGIEIYLKVK
jgi:hypothetical protein